MAEYATFLLLFARGEILTNVLDDHPYTYYRTWLTDSEEAYKRFFEECYQVSNTVLYIEHKAEFIIIGWIIVLPARTAARYQWG